MVLFDAPRPNDIPNTHVARCPEEVRTFAFEQSAQMMEQWLEKNNTHPDLQTLLLWYLSGRGSTTCFKCSKELNLPHIIQEFAASQDIIGCDGFIMGMVSSKLLLIQSAYLFQCNSSYQAACWFLGVITQILQVTHSQWIYQCVLVHDRTTGTLILSHKDKLLKEIDHQLLLGPKGLSEEDQFLLECNFDELTSTAGKQQEYWLLAIQAAQEVSRSRGLATTMQQHGYKVEKGVFLIGMQLHYAYAQSHPGDLNISQEHTSWKERALSPRFRLQHCFASIACGILRLLLVKPV